MSRHFFLLLLLLGFTSACRSLKVRDFHSKQGLSNRLPALELRVHEVSFLAAFDGALTRDIMFNNFPATPMDGNPWSAYAVTDLAVQDVFQVFENELRDHINQRSGPNHGQARFKLRFYQRRNSGWGWTVASFATGLIPNMLGMPIRTQQVVLELQMEVVDANGYLLRQYVASGQGKAQVAVYHGYSVTTAARKANLRALKRAMSKIKTELDKEVLALSSQLEKTRNPSK